MSEEINLSELEEWYMKQLEERFKREHKILRRSFEKAGEEVAQAKNALNAWKKSEPKDSDNKIDEKSKKIMDRFIETVIESLDEVEIPTIHSTITYENTQKFIDGIKKVYTTYNSQGKKAMKRFFKEYKLEIKEIDLHLRKLGEYSQKVGKFMLKHYKEGKEAESVTKKIPLLENNIERLGSTKTKLDEMEATLSQMQTDLNNMINDLEKINEDQDLQKFEKIETHIDHLKRELLEQLKFKKAFKKMKKFLEKGSIALRDINESDLKPYIKDPVSTILSEGPKIPHLREILIKTRIMLEDEKDYLQLKSDLKTKVIENINDIVTDHSLEQDIQEILDQEKEKGEIYKILQSKGLDTQRSDLKEKIAIATVDLEHFENDVARYRRDYKDLLGKVKEEREELHNLVKDETEQEIKVKVIIPS